MHALALTYQEFLETDPGELTKVREFADCVVWMVDHDGPLLVVEDAANRRVAAYAFGSEEERERAVERVQRMPEGGGPTGAGLLAPVGPQPPARSPGRAEPLPGSLDERRE